ncbi:uncharacterized protein MELLADRAFT_112196 [Melampsora larici-populina 98AG31]|uniref:Uncharacterized protein n=1 Tax=Melampsora larici-populina (strain 98AG31 / pathotype 3-4-7) TaxID=747676 RepID=F4S5P0_MELLP|nr:uncharacterized protein MELLADRAFT_112196 [Melampsora larici-populina 98AG31]EGG00062.1 hypothetical protein MELLADRAFT_112196 [Melampsora larici-populina 98AG31]
MIPKQVFLSFTREILTPRTIEKNLKENGYRKGQDCFKFSSEKIHDDLNTLVQPISVESIILGNWKVSENDQVMSFDQKIPNGLENDLTMIDHHPFTNHYKGYHLDDINSVMSSWDEFENPKETTPMDSPRIKPSEGTLSKNKALKAPCSMDSRQSDTQDHLAKDKTKRRDLHIGKYVGLQPTLSSKKIRKSKAMKDLLKSTKSVSSSESNDVISIETIEKNWLKKKTRKMPDLDNVLKSTSVVDYSNGDLSSVDNPLKGEIPYCNNKKCVSQDNNVKAKFPYPASERDQRANHIQKHAKPTKKESKSDEKFRKQLEQIMRPVSEHFENLANIQLTGINKELKYPNASKKTTKPLGQSPDHSIGKDATESREQVMDKGLENLASQAIKSNKKASEYDSESVEERKIRELESMNTNNDSNEPFQNAKRKHASVSEAQGIQQSTALHEWNEYKRKSDRSTPAKLLRTKNLEDISGSKTNRHEIGSQSEHVLTIIALELKNILDIQLSGSSTVNGKRTEDIHGYEQSIQIDTTNDWRSKTKRKQKKMFPADDHTDSQQIPENILSEKVIPKQNERKTQLSSQEMTNPSTRKPKQVNPPSNNSSLLIKIRNHLRQQGEVHRSFRRSHEESYRKTRDLVFTYAHQGKQIIEKNKELFEDMSRAYGSVEKSMTKNLSRHLAQLNMKTFNSIVSFKAEHIIFPIFIRQVSWICKLTQDLSMITKDYKLGEKFTNTPTVYVSASEFFRKWLKNKALEYLHYVEENINKPIWKDMNEHKESPRGNSSVQLIHHLEFATLTPKWTVISWDIFWEWLKTYDSTLHELTQIQNPKTQNLLRQFKIHYAREVMQQMIEKDGQFFEMEFCIEHKIPRGKFKRLKSETLY